VDCHARHYPCIRASRFLLLPAVKRLISSLRIASTRIVFALARRLPLSNRVVLATAHKARLDGNLEAVRVELARREPPIPVVKVAYRPERGPLGLARTWLNELRAAYHLARARVFVVDDYFFPIYAIRPRPGTKIIQVWHAAGPVKRSGYGVAEKTFGADRSLIERVQIHSNYDVCIVGSRSAAELYSVAFRQPVERFVSHLGIPRSDMLFGEERTARAQQRIRERYRLPADRRVILYAPTFRGDDIASARFPDFIDFRLLHELLGGDHVMLVRKHPFVRAPLAIDDDLRGFVIDVSDYPEINELMLVADVLVTDYSSSIYEFSLRERPIVFFAPDHAAYERQRGFFLDYRNEGPGPVFATTRELGDYLRAGDFDLERVRRFRQKWFEVADGHASQRFVDELVVPQLAGS
jgi:teichoic acid ribitol-phosphate primase